MVVWTEISPVFATHDCLNGCLVRGPVREVDWASDKRSCQLDISGHPWEVIGVADDIEIAPDAFEVVAVFDLTMANEVSKGMNESRLTINDIDALPQRF